MSHLMVGHDPPLIHRYRRILSLITGYHDFHALFQVFLQHGLTPLPYRTQCRLVDDIGKLRSACARSRPSDRLKIHIIRQLYILSMYFQDRHTPF